MVGVAPDDDDDGNAASEGRPQNAAPRQQTQQAPTPEQQATKEWLAKAKKELEELPQYEDLAFWSRQNAEHMARLSPAQVDWIDGEIKKAQSRLVQSPVYPETKTNGAAHA
jgi:FtsZ-interacting cell division protein YlmF